MSWEDCGFKPGKIYGPTKCPVGRCGDCDGEHHFYIACQDGCLDDDEDRPELPEGLDPSMFFECKHCGTFAEGLPKDEPPPPAPGTIDELLQRHPQRIVST